MRAAGHSRVRCHPCHRGQEPMSALLADQCQLDDSDVIVQAVPLRGRCFHYICSTKHCRLSSFHELYFCVPFHALNERSNTSEILTSKRLSLLKTLLEPIAVISYDQLFIIIHRIPVRDCKYIHMCYRQCGNSGILKTVCLGSGNCSLQLLC